ncbi:ribonuclease Y-like [Macrobrachium rosenbergii]|uniref:ribonuclease Y-like n=1 Tax=Macrobrachium rosenbergii TaxID=79674 RepID=UPI0034D3C919
MATEHYRTFMDLEKASLTGPELSKWVKKQADNLAKQVRNERAEQRWYAEEKRQLEDAREERRRQHELALKENEQALEASEQALKASEQALKASEQALKASELALKERELELEKARKESAEARTEGALVLAKHMKGKAQAAHWRRVKETTWEKFVGYEESLRYNPREMETVVPKSCQGSQLVLNLIDLSQDPVWYLLV